MRSLLCLLLATLCLHAQAAQERASTAYPNKPIRMVMPFSPGGGTDLVGRLLAKEMSEGLGQPVIPDNRPGAGGKSLQAPVLLDNFAKLGVLPGGSASPDEARAYFLSEVERYSKLVKQIGLKID